MTVADFQILKKLDKNDQERIMYFLKLLLKQSKYRKLKQEIAMRREEIKRGDVLAHNEIWNQLDV